MRMPSSPTPYNVSDRGPYGNVSPYNRRQHAASDAVRAPLPRVAPNTRRYPPAMNRRLRPLLALSAMLVACAQAGPAVPDPETTGAPSPTGAVSRRAPSEPVSAGATSPAGRPTPPPVLDPPQATQPVTGPTATPTRSAPEIAYVRDGALYTLPPGGGEPRTLESGPVAAPEWSPAGGALAYIRLRGRAGGGALVLRSGGGAPRVLVARGVTQLAWSPDGKTLAYTRTADRDGDGRLAPDADRSAVRLLTPATGADRPLASGFDPAWTPDGRGVLLSTPGTLRGGVPGGNALRLYEPETGRSRTLTRVSDVPSDLRQYGTPFLAMPRLLRYGAISPDGATVAFSALGGVGVLGTKELDGGTVQVQDTLPESGFGPVRWRPGGTRIAYHIPAPSGGDVVTVLDVRTGNRASLGGPRDPAGYRDPAWSPDGARLALVRTRDGQPEALVVAQPDGTELRMLIRGEVEAPDWGYPRGSAIP